MNIDEKRSYLKMYRVLFSKIKRLREMLAMFPERKDEYNEEISKTLAVRNKIEDAINAVDGSIMTEILSQKYICGRSLEEIGRIINYSKRQTERLHLRALQKLVMA